MHQDIPSIYEPAPAAVCCRMCGKPFASVLAYARANELTRYIPEYHHLGKEHLAAQYQQHQIHVFPP
jgi:hypothetical protein